MKALASISCAALVGLAIAGCDDNRLAGNTAGTENARVIRVDSVIPDWVKPAGRVTVATLRLNADNFDFRGTDSAGRDLVVLKETGDTVPFDVVYWDRLARLGRLQVRIDSMLQAPRGRFLLKWHQEIRQRSNPYLVWQAISDSQKLALTSVPVADFETSMDTTLLPTRPVWFFGSSKDSGSDSSSISSHSFLPAGGGRTGTALSVAFRTTGGGYAVVKTPLVVGEGHRNLRALDSLVFWVKGTKGMNMFTAIEHDSTFKAWKLDTLDSVWTRISIVPSDFIPASNPNGGNRGWDAVRDSATDLTFLLYGGTKFQLDDIRLYGIDREDVK